MATKIVSIQNAKPLIREVLSDFELSVVSTFGPLGKTVIIPSTGNVPHVTKDGVTVIESIHYKDEIKNNVASLIKEAARKTAEEVGDGTTVSTLLTIKLINKSLIYFSSHFRMFAEGVDKAIDYIIEFLQEEIVEVDMESEEIEAIIKISSNSDPGIVSLLMKVIKEIGPHGIIDVKSGDSITEVKLSNGAVIDERTVIIPGFKSVYETSLPSTILLVEGPIHDVYEIKEVMKYAASSKVPMLIVAQEFSDTVERIVTINNQNKSCEITLVIAEAFGTSRLQILQDLALITNATIVSTTGATIVPIQEFTPSMLGKLEGFVVDPRQTIIYGVPSILESKEVLNRKTLLAEEYAKQRGANILNTSGEARVLKRRLSKFVNVATIFVGGITEAEKLERKDRIDDSVAAVAAAVNGGVLPGGGSSLYRAKAILQARKKDFTSSSQIFGMQVVEELCTEVLTNLANNSGYTLTEKDYKQIYEDSSLVYDVINQKLVDAYSSGILDPALVLIKALTNAAAVNKSIANSSTFIIDDRDEIQRKD